MDARIRLRPWLESRLNEEWIPGLDWIDKEMSIFKIPWKHHSKHTWSEDDALIFKDWAVVTGRFREGIDTPDWPMWKTRLRCALNKALDIQEVKQRHNLHCDEPFKVYRFISKTESLWRANASRNASMVFDGVPSTGTMITSASAPVILRRSFPAGLPSKLGNGPTFLIQKQPNNSLNLIQQPSWKPITLVQRTRNGELIVKQMPTSTTPILSDSMGASVDPLDIGANQEVPGGYGSNDGAACSYYDPSGGPRFLTQGGGNIVRRLNLSAPVVQQPVPYLPDIMEPELHQLCLRIQHLAIRVKDTIVTNPNGCCIYYGRYDESDSPTAPEPQEPPIPQFVSEKNKPYVDLLLDNMQRGVIITVSHGSIYAERLCKCAVFVYVPTGLENDFRFIRKLSRREREKIFDYDQFLEDVEMFRLGQRGLKPPYEIILAFGQQLKPSLTTDGLLVWCRLANCKAWFIMQRMMMPGQNTGFRTTPSLTPKMEDIDVGVGDGGEEVIEEGVEELLDGENDMYDGLEASHDFSG